MGPPHTPCHSSAGPTQESVKKILHISCLKQFRSPKLLYFFGGYFYDIFFQNTTCKKCSNNSIVKSDHSTISLSVNSLKDQPFGPSYWKFNSSLLDDHNYIQLIHSEYPKWITEFSEVKDNRVSWDLIKYRIRQTTTKYSKVIAKNRKAQRLRAEEILKLCKENFNSDPSEENITKLDEARSEYKTLYNHIIQGKIIRSRANWYE